MKSQRFQTCLWIDGDAEKAAKFYLGIFPKSRIVARIPVTPEVSAANGMQVGSTLCTEVDLDGQRFLVLSGRPSMIMPSMAVSHIILCKDQMEVDHYWKKLGAGGPKEMQNCGWLQDKYGVTWQVVPIRQMEMVKSQDHKKVDRMMKAMMPMKKINLAKLEQAFKG